MSPKARSSITTIVVVMLASAALLAMTVFVLLWMRTPARTAVTPLATSDSGILITAVPTVGRVSSLVPSPLPTLTPAVISPSTKTANPSVQTARDSSAGVSMSTQSPVLPTIPGPLVDPSFGLRTGPVAVPLELQIPALKIKAPVLGVGLTLMNQMASPIGILPDDPIWQTVFWYRGGDIPGDVGTATFAGHFDDALGRPAVFAYLDDLQIGDLIVVQDQRSGLDIPFIVTEIEAYTDQEAAAPAVLARVFGSASVGAAESSSVSDQLSHLTLITCSGEWVNGSFNLRLVVYATRASYPSE